MRSSIAAEQIDSPPSGMSLHNENAAALAEWRLGEGVEDFGLEAVDVANGGRAEWRFHSLIVESCLAVAFYYFPA